MRVQILTTGEENFVWLLENTAKYRKEHDIRVSTQPYVVLGEYDIGISFMHQYRVLPEQVNSHTWLNFHPAPLPEYKGRNLCYHAIMNGEKEFGATLHYMDENFDTGHIIDVSRFGIEDSWTAENLSERTIKESKAMFYNFFPRIVSGQEFIPFANKGGTYYTKESIPEIFFLSEEQQNFVRAVTYKNFYPKVEIGGVTYKIVRDER